MRLFNKAHEPIPSLRELVSRVSFGDGKPDVWFNGEPSICFQLDARQHRQALRLLNALGVSHSFYLDYRRCGFLEFPVKPFLNRYAHALRSNTPN